MPSSSSSNAFARRVRRVSAFPSRTSAIRSARVPGSRKPPRIIPLQESLDPAPASFFVNRWNRGIHLRLENPKIGGVDDAEVVGDRIAEDSPVFRHLLAQEMQNRSAEVVIARVAPVVGHVFMHQS